MSSRVVVEEVVAGEGARVGESGEMPYPRLVEIVRRAIARHWVELTQDPEPAETREDGKDEGKR